MNKTAIYGILLAIILPVACYFIVDHYSKTAVILPARYFPDSITSQLKDGKKVSDTTWHQLSNFKLTNQLGETVTLDKYRGKTIIADFFFTHCPTICPRLTMNMRRLQQSVTNLEKVGDRMNKDVQFISFSIDPERDSVPQLKAWGDRFQVDPDQWDLLTGDKKTIYDLALNDMKIGLVDGKGIDTSFIHTDHFVLIDSSRVIRGFYHGLDSASLAKLSQDLILLTLEKKPNEKGPLSGQMNFLAAVFLFAALMVGLFLIVFKKKKNVDSLLDQE
ncbi:MAG: SCO family protein [Niabella sp.]|nr:SCO family protein [Niabella sp.]